MPVRGTKERVESTVSSVESSMVFLKDALEGPVVGVLTNNVASGLGCEISNPSMHKHQRMWIEQGIGNICQCSHVQ